MEINWKTLEAMNAAIRHAIKADQDMALAALESFVRNASLNDWDALEEEKPT